MVYHYSRQKQKEEGLMKIGVGLPDYIPWIRPADILAWARKAEEAGFTSLGTIDRLVYRNYEPLISLAAAAAVTERIRLMTTVLLAPLHNTAILAKQAATLDAISGGRLTLGLGVGARPDDFQAAQVPFEHRGTYFTHQVERMKRIWNGQPAEEGLGLIGPSPAQKGGPEILLGGYTPQALKRVGRLADGYISGGGADPIQVKQLYQVALESWRKANRPGDPRFVGAIYVALGPQEEVDKGKKYLHDYYGERAVNLKTTPQEIETTVHALADIGMQELILWATVPDLDQLNYIADAAAKLRS
jgi:alkanesulfonate monooxygenase SsuD/methylene tetrahydromethanopterin reductase-like flavin-dependent oxidoreductase (luciferase family)